MKKWIQKISVLVGAGVVYLVGQYFRGVWFEHLPINLCLYSEGPNRAYCNWPYFETLGLPLIAAGEIFAIVGAILLFANASGLRAWWKLSIWYVPVITLFVMYAAPLPLFPVVAPLSRESVVWFFGFIYIVLSLGAVLRGRVLERNH